MLGTRSPVLHISPEKLSQLKGKTKQKETCEDGMRYVWSTLRSLGEVVTV